MSNFWHLPILRRCPVHLLFSVCQNKWLTWIRDYDLILQYRKIIIQKQLWKRLQFCNYNLTFAFLKIFTIDKMRVLDHGLTRMDIPVSWIQPLLSWSSSKEAMKATHCSNFSRYQWIYCPAIFPPDLGLILLEYT